MLNDPKLLTVRDRIVTVLKAIAVPASISPCDATTDWTGTSLSIDNDDKKEGTGSLKDTVASPVVGTTYTTEYNPSGTWDWSNKKHILFWLKSDRASTAFAEPRFLIYDTLGNWSRWNLTFSAGEWTAFKLLLSTPDSTSATPADLALIINIQVRFTAADTTPFYKKIDHITVGDDYHRTPYDVTARFVHWREASGYPLYMVYIESSEPPEFAGTELYDQNVIFTIKGYVKHDSDTLKEMLYSMADIRKAINTDSKSGVAATLGTLTVQTRIQDFWTDDGYLSLEGFGFFNLRISVTISGDEGEL